MNMNLYVDFNTLSAHDKAILAKARKCNASNWGYIASLVDEMENTDLRKQLSRVVNHYKYLDEYQCGML